MLARLIPFAFVMTLATFVHGAETFPLWVEGAPGALGSEPKDVPALTVYLPDASAEPRAAMVICPGGGYAKLMPHEGDAYAQWLNTQGIVAFVLTYRLAPSGYHHPAMLDDATRAMRIVRARGAEWMVDPHRIGIIGSSAGGHLAAMVLTHFDAGDPQSKDPIEQQSSRPDLGILCYAVVTLEGPSAHVGSRRNLLGESPSAELLDSLSPEKQVTKGAPPCFIWSTGADEVVSSVNSMMFASALDQAGVPYELHIYARGRHGLGLGLGSISTSPESMHPWVGECARWLRESGFIR